MGFLERFKGFRTVIINGVVFLVGSVVAVWPESEAAAPTAEQITQAVDWMIGAVAMVISAANIVMRFVTSTPVFSDKPKGEEVIQ